MKTPDKAYVCGRCKEEGYFKRKTAVCLGCMRKFRLCPKCFTLFTHCGGEGCERAYREAINAKFDQKITFWEKTSAEIRRQKGVRKMATGRKGSQGSLLGEQREGKDEGRDGSGQG